MIKIEKSVHGIPMITVWYADKRIASKGIITYKESLVPIGKAHKFVTLINDLTEDDNIIKSHFSSNCRNQVGRAYREGSSCEILNSSLIGDEDIETFVDFFGCFWKSKESKLDNPKEFMEELKRYRDIGALVISKGIVGGEVCIYHTYLIDDIHARLLYSASLFRMIDGDDSTNAKQVIGRANRMLHYEDMLYLKQMGLKIYDWGGAGREDDVISITKFKESFGGKEIYLHNSDVCNGIKAKIVILASQIKRKIKG